MKLKLLALTLSLSFFAQLTANKVLVDAIQSLDQLMTNIKNQPFSDAQLPDLIQSAQEKLTQKWNEGKATGQWSVEYFDAKVHLSALWQLLECRTPKK